MIFVDACNSGALGLHLGQDLKNAGGVLRQAGLFASTADARSYEHSLAKGGVFTYVLESGIDIVARPPGKQLQSISLLSGGEQTMTAVALLFSIYQVKPSPFCVLDEVDAPLDDANIHRFLRVLRELTSQTQFLVITHNRKTMEAADILYGVTMEEPGLSKLVSVNLAAAVATSGN